MSDTNAQEPTMEEILASIRRIISEDDAPPAAPEDTPPAAVEAAGSGGAGEPANVPAMETTPSEEEDVLELTNPLDASAPKEAPAQSLGDLDLSSPPPPTPTKDETLVSGRTASAAASSFGQLSRTVGMPQDNRTLEDIVNQLLRPLLKDWLDANLPSIVEAKVQLEVERISRSRGF